LKRRRLSGLLSSWPKVAVMFARQLRMLLQHTVRIGLNNNNINSMVGVMNVVDQLRATGELKEQTDLSLRHEVETLRSQDATRVEDWAIDPKRQNARQRTKPVATVTRKDILSQCAKPQNVKVQNLKPITLV
jgi:hypothetical protein